MYLLALLIDRSPADQQQSPSTAPTTGNLQEPTRGPTVQPSFVPSFRPSKLCSKTPSPYTPPGRNLRTMQQGDNIVEFDVQAVDESGQGRQLHVLEDDNAWIEEDENDLLENDFEYGDDE